MIYLAPYYLLNIDLLQPRPTVNSKDLNDNPQSPQTSPSSSGPSNVCKGWRTLGSLNGPYFITHLEAAVFLLALSQASS